MWLIAGGGVVFCGMMAYSLPNATWWRLLIWSLIGFALYFFYGYRHSRLRRDGAARRDPGRDRARACLAPGLSRSAAGARRMLISSTATENAIAKYR